MVALRRVLSALIAPLRPKGPVPPLCDWNFSPAIHPTQAARGHGGHLVDDKGREWIDLNSAWGANILGYGYPRVAEAIADQARCFAGLGLPYEQFWELGRRLCELIPGAEQVRYGKNGSDATMGAVRLARAITRRERVLHHGYHGFHDWWMASTGCQGIPEALRGLIAPIGALTPEAVEAALRRHPGQVACLILDPMVPPMAEAETIREIIGIVHRHGALVIFDEVVSGFRLAPGGAQEAWGVRPDLCCFGKCVANGLPLSVLGGREEHMRHLPAINYGMTFEGEAISIAAAMATLSELTERQVCTELARKGRFLKCEYARLAEARSLKTSLAGPDARPHLFFEPHGDLAERPLRWLVIEALARENILTLGTFNLCFSHHEEDLRAIVRAFDKALALARRAVERGTVRGLMDERLHQSMQED